MVLYRYLFLFSGLILFGLGTAMAVEVKYLGLHPWDVLNVALYDQHGLTIGTWGIICGLLLMAVSFVADRRYINIGTVLNAMLIGPITDFFLWSDILPNASHTWMDYLILLAGIVLTGMGGGLYIAAGLGAGPRDGFMLSLSDKTRLSVSQARIIVESLVLIAGYFLGGPVFVMTFIYTFIQSPVFQYSLAFFRKLLQTAERKHKDSQVIT
ncbi:YczE/YyaS/YitT family protein [Peribacillus sp. NPDC097895]|uniref:YczE/YyaS/YitT family protein n=1 Tax=Peribacillus sp. NPDC097895 TaxID=3390619 RepID=UPI003D012D42